MYFPPILPRAGFRLEETSLEPGESCLVGEYFESRIFCLVGWGDASNQTMIIRTEIEKGEKLAVWWEFFNQRLLPDGN